jgi:hypothetical protein
MLPNLVVNPVTVGETAPGLTFPWAEFISRSGHTMDGSFSHQGSRATMRIMINASDFVNTNGNGALGQILGYSNWLNGGVTFHRQLPMIHPIFPWLYCTQVSGVQPLRPLGRKGGEKSKVVGGGGSYQGYERYILTLGFASLPYFVLADATVTTEDRRFVIKNCKPSSKFLSLQGGIFNFADGPSLNTPFANSTGQLVAKKLIELTWVNTAQAFTAPQPVGEATQLDSLIGSVNADAVFLGKPQGTLYFDSYEQIPVEAPVSPGVVGVGAGPPLMWTIKLRLVYFNPPAGNPNFRGHNLFPSPIDNQWWLARAKAGGLLYQPKTWNGVMFGPSI